MQARLSVNVFVVELLKVLELPDRKEISGEIHDQKIIIRLVLQLTLNLGLAGKGIRHQKPPAARRVLRTFGA